MLFQSLILFSLIYLNSCSSAQNNKQEKDVKEKDTQQSSEYNPLGALVRCSFLPMEFLECDSLKDHEGNQTARDELGYGCLKFGGSFFHEVERTKTFCNVLPEIECQGLRKFQRDGFPCVKYGDHYFLTTLLYSILLGFLGMDRFCLGQTGTAVGKLLTLGGVGIWYFIDIVLLATGNLTPENENWNTQV